MSGEQLVLENIRQAFGGQETDGDIVLPVARARGTDPWTSHAAARSIEVEALRASQQAVLDCFASHGPMHHERLIEIYGAEYRERAWPPQSVSGLRTRTHELVEAGVVMNSGRVIRLASGRRSIIWKLTPERP